jgi:hypothetical protein
MSSLTALNLPHLLLLARSVKPYRARRNELLLSTARN